MTNPKGPDTRFEGSAVVSSTPPAGGLKRPVPQKISRAALEPADPDALLDHGELEEIGEVIDLTDYGFEVVLDKNKRVVSVEAVGGAVADKVVAAMKAVPTEMRNAVDVIPPLDLKKALERNPLLQKVGVESMRKILKGCKSVMVPNGAEIIGPNSGIKGMFVPTERMKVQISTGSGSDLKVKERELDFDSYLGEYVMAIGANPTATVTNMSPETEMVFISAELFASLHPRSKEGVKLEILRKSPLVNYSEKDPALDSSDPDAGQSGYVVNSARKKALAVFDGIRVSTESVGSFRPNYVKNYQKGDEITPSRIGYAGLIVSGNVSVDQTGVDGEMAAIKKAENQAGNTLFEANAVGVEPPDEIVLSAESEQVQILWVDLSPDNGNYEALLDALLDGQAAKLANSNIRTAAIKRGV